MELLVFIVDLIVYFLSFKVFRALAHELLNGIEIVESLTSIAYTSIVFV